MKRLVKLVSLILLFLNMSSNTSAEGDTRNVQLDLIPADMIQTIEVNKVVTPDMDGDAIGGSINLVTKNSPYKRTIVIIREYQNAPCNQNIMV